MLRLLLPLFSLVSLVLGQGSVVADSTSAVNSALAYCTGCYAIANVDLIVFGNQGVQTQTVSYTTGKNGTVVTSTLPAGPQATGIETIDGGGGVFSFGPSGLITGGSGGSFIYPTATIFTLSGHTLTYPTAVEFFQGYSTISLGVSNGVCVTQTGPAVSETSPFAVTVPADPGPLFLVSAEQSFINNGPLTCSPGGANVNTMTAIPPVSSTTRVTIGVPSPSGGAVPTALPETESASASASATSSASITLLNPSAAASTTFTTEIPLPGNATGTVIIAGNATSIITGSGPSATIVPFMGAASLLRAPSGVFVALGLVLPGVLALLL